MSEKKMDTSLLDRALVFAVKAHSGVERRGKGFPYVVHVMEAVEIVATMTPDQELLAAAALHDTIEDTPVTFEDLKAEFGERVALLVDAESDRFTPGVSETDSWRGRKQAAIDRLAAASRDAKMVALGDKLSNLRAIWRDYETIGDELWSRFHAPGGKADHEWHYRGLADSLSELSGTFAYREFSNLVEKVFGHSKPELVNMADYVQSGDGFTATSYTHKDGKVMMKLYEPFISAYIPVEEYKTAAAVKKMGLATPSVCRVVTDGRRTGVEFELVSPKLSFTRAISKEPDYLEFYAREFARRVRELHSTECVSNVFPDVRERYRKLILGLNSYTDEEKEKILKFIDRVPEKHTCLHGDLHTGNMIINTQTGRQYWIDLADFAWGNPWFDLGMWYFCTNLNDPEHLNSIFHLGQEQMRRCWEVFVDEYFGTNMSIDEVERQVKPFAALRMLDFESRGINRPDMRDYIENTLL